MAALFFVFIVSSIVSGVLTFVVRQHLLAREILDVPNERSMHQKPIPRGGGLAVMAVVCGGILFLVPNLFLFLGLLLLIAVSWADDKRSLRASLRLCVHLLAAFLGSLSLGDGAVVFGGLLPFGIDRFILIIGWAWFMNLYNFMDGIDGITGTQTVTNLIGIAFLLGLLSMGGGEGSLVALLLGAVVGFLVWNWPPAKIFLGDVGSVPLGFLMGFLLLKIAMTGALVSALVLPLYYLADSTITLLKRFVRGEKVWQAHREHFYQRATASLGHSSPVLKQIMLANSGLCLAAILALSNPWLGGAAGVIITAILLLWMENSAQKKQI